MEPKVLTKRCFKNFSERSFLQDLQQKLSKTGNFSDFNYEFKNSSAPIKASKIHGNKKLILRLGFLDILRLFKILK